MLPARKKKPRTGLAPEGPYRSYKHLQWIRGFECFECGSGGKIEAAHVRIGTDGSTGEKPSDYWTIPLCIPCHDIQHDGERTFWGLRDPKKIALEFARKSTDPIIKSAALRSSGTDMRRLDIREYA